MRERASQVCNRAGGDLADLGDDAAQFDRSDYTWSSRTVGSFWQRGRKID